MARSTRTASKPAAASSASLAIWIAAGLLVVILAVVLTVTLRSRESQARQVESTPAASPVVVSPPVDVEPKSLVATPAPAVVVAEPQVVVEPAESAESTGSVVTASRGPYIVPAGRSPIPHEGEDIRRPLPVKRLVKEVTPDVPEAPTEPVPWSQAHRYFGQTITIEGTVVNTRSSGSVCFLNFTDNWQNDFYIIIFKDAFPGFPEPPETYFLNKTVHATGEIFKHGQRPQIRVTKASQIKIVGEEMPDIDPIDE